MPVPEAERAFPSLFINWVTQARFASKKGSETEEEGEQSRLVEIMEEKT